MPVLEVQHVTKLFGNDPAQAIPMVREGRSRDEIVEKTGQILGVGDVSFSVEKGEIVVVMGLSGSGKSTIIRCLNRLIDPSDGAVLIDGEDICAYDPTQLRQLRRQRIGMVFQRFALFPHRTVCDNAAYGLEVNGVERAERRARANEVLEMVGLGGWEDKYPHELSGGMQQRVGLSRALAADPEIILMDEAFSALDPLIRKDMQGEILRLQRRLDKTVVFITHDLDEAINIGDRIVLMKDGRVVQIGTPEDILTNPASGYVERFIEDVDVSKVLTAESVMKVVHDLAHLGDGPRAVLRKCQEAGLSTLFAVDSEGVFHGVVRAETARKLADGSEAERELKVKDFLESSQRRVQLDAPLQEVLPMMTERRDAVAVCDEDGRIQGVVVIGALLAGISEGVGESGSDREAVDSSVDEEVTNG